jgi:hypothetical protein
MRGWRDTIEGTMPGFDEDSFWKFAAWTTAICISVMAATLALSIEPSLLG